MNSTEKLALIGKLYDSNASLLRIVRVVGTDDESLGLIRRDLGVSWKTLERTVEEVKAVKPTVLRTSELRRGDVVLCHGMRCLIDREIKESTAHPASVFWTQALVLNREDERTHLVPNGWTADWDRNRRGHDRPHDGEHRWTIQGNDNATWWVER